MIILCLLTGALLVWGRVAAKPPPPDVVTEDLQLAINEMLLTRAGNESFIYHFPNPALRVMDGTTINVFGIKTTGGFTLQLYPLADNPKPAIFTITKSDKGWKVQYLSAWHKYKNPFKMPKDKFVWFIIERTNDYLALYRVGEAKPVLTASNKVLKTKLNFNTLQRYRISSTKDALWDFLGYRYDRGEVGKPPKYPFLGTVVQKVRKSYGGVDAHLKRCDYAEANLSGSKNNARFFLTLFIEKNCKDKKILLQLKEMRVRYKTLLLASGVKPPAAPTDEKCKKFIMDKRSLKL